jgi:MFS family permease
VKIFALQLIADIRGLPRGVFVLVGGQFINRCGTFVHPFLALFLTGRDIGMGQVALVLGAMSVGSLVAPVVSGYLSDAIGRRNTIVFSLVTSAVSLLALYWCRTLPEYMAIGAINGFCNFLFGPATNALLTDLVTKEQRVLAFALLRLAINAGFAVGPAVAGLLFTRAPVMIFVGNTVSTLAFALLAWIWLPHGLRTVSGRTAEAAVIWQSWREALVDVGRNHRYQQFLVALLFMAIAFVQGFHVLAVTAVDRGLTPAAYGLVMAFNGVLIVAIELPLNQWMRHFDTRRVLIVGYALIGFGTAAFGLVHTVGGFFAAMALFTVGEMISLPIGNSYNGDLAPEKYRGRYFGLSSTVWAIAGLMGSAGVWLYGILGTSWWLIAGTFGLLGAAVMLPRLPAREDRPLQSSSSVPVGPPLAGSASGWKKK